MAPRLRSGKAVSEVAQPAHDGPGGGREGQDQPDRQGQPQGRVRDTGGGDVEESGEHSSTHAERDHAEDDDGELDPGEAAAPPGRLPQECERVERSRRNHGRYTAATRRDKSRLLLDAVEFELSLLTKECRLAPIPVLLVFSLAAETSRDELLKTPRYVQSKPAEFRAFTPEGLRDACSRTPKGDRSRTR